MRRALRSVGRQVQHERSLSQTSSTTFVCPALLRPLHAAPPPASTRQRRPLYRCLHTSPRRLDSKAATLSSEPHSSLTEHAVPNSELPLLPVTCPGCGAPTQIIDQEAAGYYDVRRGAVKSYLTGKTKESPLKAEKDVFTKVIQQADPELLEKMGLKDTETNPPPPSTGYQPPTCERCHNLLNHSRGVPIFHPSIESIQAIIEESPYKHNHIYHVVDAVDFPMSLIPQLQRALELPKMRTQNRRSKHLRWQHGRVADVSFIITRSDLLAPMKDQVDSLMPYMQDVLRDALGATGKNLRLGNVRLVSAKRGWWTKEVKDAIWERGGAGWMVGKVNVGKSNLFNVVFPKGRTDTDVNIDRLRAEAGNAALKENKKLDPMEELLAASNARTQPPVSEEEPDKYPEDLFSEDSLLPPPQPATPYPVLPIVSSLPGTTASPIRVPFGNGKGELIDLPGIARSDLDQFVLPEHRASLVMKSRITPTKDVLKPTQSLLLGGNLIRLTPATPDQIFIAHAFTPIKSHITSTEKAIGITTGTRPTAIDTIATPETGARMALAGRFPLKWDITKRAAGPLTDPAAVKLRTSQLPFVVYAADILIEGVGWVEVQAQVRRRRVEMSARLAAQPPPAEDDEPQPNDVAKEEENLAETEKPPSPPSSTAKDEQSKTLFRPFHLVPAPLSSLPYPEIEVYSPDGRFVAVRRPMGASFLGGPKPKPRNERKTRPRRSMRSVRLGERARRGREG